MIATDKLNEEIAKWLGWVKHGGIWYDGINRPHWNLNFTSDIRQTELLIKKLAKRGYNVYILAREKGYYVQITVGVPKLAKNITTADTMPLAVAQAVGELIRKEGE